MKTETKVLGIILLVTVALLLGFVFFLGKSSNSSNNISSEVLQIDYSKGQRIGSDSAKVRLVEFSDFQCPACRSAEPYIKQVISSYGDNVQFIYRHFPLPQHQFGKKTAYLAEAAGEQGKFWQMHEKIFETQDSWSKMSGSDADSYFLKLAKELEIDESKAKEAMEGDVYKTKIDEDIAEGRKLRINSTPTFFLNGKKLNLQSFADLNTIVGEELKK
ncbi:thioredoxin domain-containing protein [Candidatus Daviesbacteria bacterium]|nr:thioredoxin domain-containing protein [Candidatus Daviesbacteria bacterium]